MKMGFARSIPAFAAAALALHMSAPARALSLEEAYYAALQQDPAYRAARHQRDAGLQNRRLGLATLLPQVSAVHTSMRNDSRITAPGPLGTAHTSEREYSSQSSGIHLRQPLYNPEAMARYRQGQAQALQGEDAFAAAGADLMLRVAEAYLALQLAQTRSELAHIHGGVLEEQVRMNERLYQAGEGTRTDLLETQARHALVQADVIEAEDRLTHARAVLSTLIGRPVPPLPPLPVSPASEEAVTLSLQQWQERALDHNAELAVLRHNIDIAGEEVRRVRAGHLPKLDLIASLARSASDTTSTIDQRSRITAAGLQFSVPIYSGGAVSAATDQATSQLERAKAELDAGITRVLLELRRHYGQWHTGAARLAALQKSVEAAQLAVDATRQSIRGGVRVNLDLLLAQQQLYAVRQELALAQQLHLLSFLQLRRLAGVLQPDDLRQLPAWPRQP